MSLKEAVTTYQLAALLNVSHSLLIDMAFNVPDHIKYSPIAVPKRNGELRHIAVPSLRLKMIQHRLMPLLEDIYLPSTRAHGYIKGRGLRSNATPHIAKRFVLNIDLVDFFGSITFPRIRGRLRAAPYSLTDAVATTIAKLATCDEKLAMGAPTSPIISNILCSGLDSTLSALAKSHGCFYTRYADDLTFSSNRRAFPRALAEREQDEEGRTTIAGVELVQAVATQGFQINASKSRLLTQHDRQEVCGIVCNEKLNTLPNLRRQIRAALHAWRKFGTEEAQREWNEKFNYRGATSFEASLRGKIEFLKHVRGPADPIVVKYATQFNELKTAAKGISFTVIEDWQASLNRVSCCIHSQNPETTDMVQGSGFVIHGGYIVTNRHVVAKGGQRFIDIELKLPGSINIAIPVDMVAELPNQDLALLKATDEMWHQMLSKSSCKISDEDANRNDVIWLTGYPNYHLGDELHEVQGSVIGFSYPEGVKMFRITPNIVFGNSGGPVFNEAGEVVGIATRGSDIADAPLTVHNGCVPASWIKELVAQLPQ